MFSFLLSGLVSAGVRDFPRGLGNGLTPVFAGVMYLSLEAVAEVLETEYSFSEGETGLAFLAILCVRSVLRLSRAHLRTLSSGWVDSSGSRACRFRKSSITGRVSLRRRILALWLTICLQLLPWVLMRECTLPASVGCCYPLASSFSPFLKVEVTSSVLSLVSPSSLLGSLRSTAACSAI